ncbi:MAG: glycosyltransferase family 4 protein, partial [Bacteroidetes bacterium]|nr:glycosyltransferase family 4 protein [Bacteroidota bacterium]
MKIALVSKNFPPNSLGGGEVSAYYLAKSLADKGVDLHVITSTYIQKTETMNFTLHPIIKEENWPGVFSYISENDVFFLNTYKAICQFLSKNPDTDILHSWNMNTIPGVVKAGLKYNIPSVITVNSHYLLCPIQMLKSDFTICNGRCNFMKAFNCYSGSNISRRILGTIYSPWQLFIRKKFAGKSDAIVSITKYMYDCINSSMKIRKHYIIPNIVETNEYLLELNQAFQSDILFVGTLNKTKGCEYLLKAIPMISRIYPKILLRIVGDGPELKHLKILSEQL